MDISEPQTQAEPTSTFTIDYLPDDILLHIFSYLDALSLCKVRRVCSAWNNLSTDEILWKHKLLADIKTWKHVSSASLPDLKQEEETSEHSKYDMYMKGSPDIQKWKRQCYQQTTLHHLTDLLRTFMPTRKYSFGVGASAMDSYGKGQSFFSKLLSFDAANVFQHCGQFPGRFRGHGGGFQFKFKRYMLELCLMYVAPKTLRDAMSIQEKVEHLESKMKSEGYLQTLASLGGYIHTIDTRIMEGSTEAETIQKLEQQSREVQLLDSHMKPDIAILVLSTRKVEADAFISSYEVSKALRLNDLSRPWMVAECSAQMIYRDIVDPMDWLISMSKCC